MAETRGPSALVDLPVELWVDIVWAMVEEEVDPLDIPRTVRSVVRVGGTSRYFHALVATRMLWVRMAVRLRDAYVAVRRAMPESWVDGYGDVGFCTIGEETDYGAMEGPMEGSPFGDVGFGDPDAGVGAGDDGEGLEEEEGGLGFVSLLEWRVAALAEAWVRMFPLLRGDEPEDKSCASGWGVPPPGWPIPVTLARDPLVFARVGAGLSPRCVCGSFSVVVDARALFETPDARANIAIFASEYEHNGTNGGMCGMSVWGVLPPEGWAPGVDALVAVQEPYEVSHFECVYCSSANTCSLGRIESLMDGIVCLDCRRFAGVFVHWCM